MRPINLYERQNMVFQAGSVILAEDEAKFSFMCIFCRSLFVLFLLDIVFAVLLRFTDSDYPFGIFKLFLTYKM